MTDKPSLHILFAHVGDQKPFGCSYIRLIQPLTHLHNERAFDVAWGVSPTDADIVIIERTWGPNTTLKQVMELVSGVRRRGARIIFTLDDNLLDLKAITTAQKMYMRYLAREADGIIVSTEPLRQRMMRLNPVVVTVPNQLDERLFFADLAPLKASHSDQLTIGYMGTPTHENDFRLIFQALRAVLRRHPGKLRFQLLGGLGNSPARKLLNDLPVDILKPPVEHVAYPNFVNWMRTNLHWDLAIAPLEDNYFNRFKSDLKFLDYSALGFPGIYSRMPVYTPTVKHLETGYLAENTPDAWVDALEFMIANPKARQQMAQNAQAYVRSERTLAQRAIDWRAAIENIKR